MFFSDELFHYGTPRHSGRYPYGSGENPYQHSGTFLNRIDELSAAGMTPTQIAEEMHMTTTQLRQRKTIELAQKRAWEQSKCLELKDHGYSIMEISRRTGLPEATVRSRLDPALRERNNRYQNTANILKEQMENGKPYLDIGSGVENQLGISKEHLRTAVAMLEAQGYKVSKLQVEQATNPGKKTTIKVLTKENVTYSEIYQNRDKIMSPMGVYSEDGGHTWGHILPPLNIDSSRIEICYYEDGGSEKDGVIELRPGVEDISLGQSSYAQVRIAVDGTHYLKGMAMYNDDLPEGVDIRFNTNKHTGTPMLGTKDDTVLKPMKDDPENPFGSNIARQLTDPSGKTVTSACNIVNEDQDWDKWSKNLSSQMLSKQEPALAKRQLDLAYKEKKEEFERLCNCEANATVKKHLLLSFADECDSDAVHLKAAALPRQRTHVILPITTLKDNEVYAPGYKTGEEVVLIRYPHQGIFEIPRLVVNNNNPEGKRLLQNPKNAIGINAKVAERLSGADFDGDTVVVIPTKGQNIKTSRPLEGLENFDPKEQYRAYPGMPEVSKKTGFYKQQEMGNISNLVTDMTLQGATMDKIARATRHAQVVIDAEKHNLDWRRSYDENGIAALKEEFQGGKNRGASTLISKANSEARVPKREIFRPERDIDPETGKKIIRETGETSYKYTKPGINKTVYKDNDGSYYYKDTKTKEKVKVSLNDIKETKNKSGETVLKYSVPSQTKTVYLDKDGSFYYKDRKTKEKIVVPAEKVKEQIKTEKSTKLAVAYDRGDDAYSLSSGTRMESIYAEHANKMRALANEARKEYLATPSPTVNKTAKTIYKDEIESLNKKLDIALKNSPRERQAQLLADSYIQKIRRDNPDIDAKELAKKKSQAIAEARIRTGSQDRRTRNIDITDKEWEAIKANAISNEKLTKILANTDDKKLKERATPRTAKTISPSAISRAKAMMNAGYTRAEAAEAIGISVSTLNRHL